MSAFLIVRKLPFRDKPARISDALEVYTQIGFRLFAELDLGHSWLWLFSGLTDEPPMIEQLADGGFVYVAGTFFFHSHYGPAAVKALAGELDIGRRSPRGSFGSFIKLCQQAGRLRVETDLSGLMSVFMNEDRSVIGSSLLAVAALCPRLTLSVQNSYEYVFNGSILGNGTMFNEIDLLPMNSELVVENSGMHILRGTEEIPDPGARTREELIGEAISLLRRRFGQFAAAFGDNLTCALSGGYDSRLMLALLRDQGVQPRLFVYGQPGDDDVRIAQTIAAGENFSVQHIDKAASTIIPAGDFPQQLKKNLFSNDGYSWGGLFNSDVENRERVRRGGRQLFLNGGGGEVFRNFFYLPDRTYSICDLTWTFYGQFDPSWCTSLFDEQRHFAALEAKVLDLMRPDENVVEAATSARRKSQRLRRVEIEWLYPAFRCRSWVARENQLGNWHGHQLFPFLDPEIAALAHQIPIAMKDLGRFEGELIRRIDPRLAAYPSAYGHDFCTSVPLLYQAKYFLGQARPPLARRLSFRLRHRQGGAEARSTYTTPDYVKIVFGDAPFETAKLFHFEKVKNAAHWNRILTVEYVARSVGRGAVIE